MQRDWQPTAPINNLAKRADILSKIRSFFSERGVLEVDTPVLSRAATTDPFLHSIEARTHAVDGAKEETLYLQTSPEFAMKRLLAAGSGSIYQICKSFRDGELGRHHHPEFTMLEWYRLGFDHHALMDEMDDLLQFVLPFKRARRFSYQAVFQKILGIDPHTVSLEALQQAVEAQQISVSDAVDRTDQDVYLQLLMSEVIEPQLTGVVFIYDYPVSQAALSQIREGAPSVAERFEVYIDGVELANGFHELADANEQRKRFESDLEKRKQCGYPIVPMDELFLASLAHGFPECAGVALGIDRLVMIALSEKHIEKVISFWDRV
ncbi:MAG: EF-P lysine aminoacylase EpmA [Pseudomonadota bacterium]|nr:EF-P lysine aminoacylase GenX [Gammaproteobacteria bacterium]MBU1558205.1 EF-P lysine aminoacylase GenX [Gammaproteobacteria bacterium]MBU1628543.1 EF-P lysine aminoacylase GenX [Gammaproteobacteria bacterium]MBU1926889.1 EF-P lysine aminoacylase GenX [Gammaproteobacteria bacterium]MBU2546350.1 EF-P lysine aminoacylase GenX [Gammaproteobacteria bacterium]